MRCCTVCEQINDDDDDDYDDDPAHSANRQQGHFEVVKSYGGQITRNTANMES